MQKLGRREFLLGLGAGSALAALGPLAFASSRLPEESSPGLRAVNVVIVGMFLFDVGTKEIVLYPPDVPGHKYVAGSLADPRPLVKGRHYRLSGPTAHARLPLADFHPDQIGVFPRHPVHTKYAYCRIALPMPDMITLGRQAPVTPGKPPFLGTPKPYREPQVLSDALILTYGHVPGPVRFASFPWAPKPKNGIENLHIWAMPSGPVPANHPEIAFRILTELMGYPHVSINPTYETMPVPPKTVPYVPGVGRKDEMDLEELTIQQAKKLKRHYSYYRGSFTCASAILY